MKNIGNTEDVINIYKNSPEGFIIDYTLESLKILGTEYLKNPDDVESRLSEILSDSGIKKVSLKSKANGVIGCRNLDKDELERLKEKLSEKNPGVFISTETYKKLTKYL